MIRQLENLCRARSGKAGNKSGAAGYRSMRVESIHMGRAVAACRPENSGCPAKGGIMKSRFFLMLPLVLFFITASTDAQEVKNMQLTSPSFGNMKPMASKFTCDGEDVSPALQWSAIPAGTKSLALIVDDPDAPDPANPRMTWVHWVIYNIPETAASLPEGVKDKDLPKGTLQGLNDWKRTGYGGPCPPVGAHRYFYKLYALDTVLADLARPTKAKLEKAMEGHVLAHAELIGLYQRK
jgi:Raf kinase inhibitor-like YbhB/YbcL family protein